MEIRDICAKEKDTLWAECRRFDNPHQTYVDLSKKLYDVKQDLFNHYHSNR